MFKLFKQFAHAGLSFKDKGFLTNFSIKVIGNSGDTYGFLSGSYGEATPSINIIDQPLYQATWDTSGNIIVSFGVTGNEQVPDVVQILMWHESQLEAITLPWNSDTTQYEGIDLTLATYLTNEVTVNGMTRTAFNVLIKPVLFIHLKMGELL